MNKVVRYSKRALRKAVLTCIRNNNTKVSVVLYDVSFPFADAVQITIRQTKPLLSFTIHWDGKSGVIIFGNGSTIRFHVKHKGFHEYIKQEG